MSRPAEQAGPAVARSRRVPVTDRVSGRVTAGLLLVCGVVNLIPVTGVLGTARIEALYGLQVTDADTLVLLRHRAVLLGLVGGVLVASAFLRSWQVPAAVAGVVSTGTYAALCLATDGLNAPVLAVMRWDLGLVVALLVVLAAHLRASRAPAGSPGTPRRATPGA